MIYFILPFLLTVVSFKSPDIIYGADNRIDTFESKSVLFKRLAKSTAAQIDQNNIRIRGQNAELIGPPLGEIFRLCKKERFYHQPFVANCSGFLVAPDIIATAGHCYEMPSNCSKRDWVFNYKVEDSAQTQVTVAASDVYKCKEVIKQALTEDLDFALIRLDRPVEGVKPVTISKTIKVGTPVVMIGHPSGLPQKITDHAVIKSISKTEFKANVDAFQINSGSGVFNALTGDLLGILVRGVVDYRTNHELGCSEVNQTSDSEPGEDIASYEQFLYHLRSANK